MATAIANTQFPLRNYFLGPFIDGNSNKYVVLLDSSDPKQIEVWKDVGGTPAEQDASNKPSTAVACRTLWAVQAGTVIHILTQDNGFEVEYHTFNTSDAGSNPDTWVTTNDSVATITDGGTYPACALIVRSDGDLIAFYQTEFETVKGKDYQRIAYKISTGGAGAWGSENALDDGGSIDYYGPEVCLGASDKAHIVYKDDTTPHVYHKSLSSGDSLSAAEALDDSAPHADNFDFCGPVYYDASGTERITAAWASTASSAEIYTSEIDNDGTPGAEEQASDADHYYNTVNMPACLAVDQTNDTVYLVYADNTTQDLWYDSNANSGGWGTDAEHLDAATVGYLSAAVLVDGSILGVVYDNGGTVYYDEIDISAGGDVLMSAAPAGVASVTAQLSVTKALSAAPAGSASVSGQLSVTKALSATPAGVSSWTADPVRIRLIAAAPAGVAAWTAQASVTYALQASPAGVSNWSVSAAVTRLLNAAPAGIASWSSQLSMTYAMQASPAGVASWSALLAMTYAMQATPVGVSSWSVTPAVIRLLSANPSGVNALTAQLSMTYGMQVNPAGVSSWSAILSGVAGDVLMAATPAGVSSLTAQLAVTKALAAAPAGISVLSAQMSMTYALQASYAAVSNVSVTPTVIRLMQANPVGISSFSAQVAVIRQMLAAPSGISALTAVLTVSTLTGEVFLAAAPAGVADWGAQLSVVRSLSATLTNISQVTAYLTLPLSLNVINLSGDFDTSVALQGDYDQDAGLQGDFDTGAPIQGDI